MGRRCSPCSGPHIVERASRSSCPGNGCTVAGHKCAYCTTPRSISVPQPSMVAAVAAAMVAMVADQAKAEATAARGSRDTSGLCTLHCCSYIACARCTKPRSAELRSGHREEAKAEQCVVALPTRPRRRASRWYFNSRTYNVQYRCREGASVIAHLTGKCNASQNATIHHLTLGLHEYNPTCIVALLLSLTLAPLLCLLRSHDIRLVIQPVDITARTHQLHGALLVVPRYVLDGLQLHKRAML